MISQHIMYTSVSMEYILYLLVTIELYLTWFIFEHGHIFLFVNGDLHGLQTEQVVVSQSIHDVMMSHLTDNNLDRNRKLVMVQIPRTVLQLQDLLAVHLQQTLLSLRVDAEQHDRVVESLGFACIYCVDDECCLFDWQHAFDFIPFVLLVEMGDFLFFDLFGFDEFVEWLNDLFRFIDFRHCSTHIIWQVIIF